MSSLYLKKNPEWITTPDKIIYHKGGFTIDLIRRLQDDHYSHSFLTSYKYIYTIISNDSVHIKCDLDKIIFMYGRNDKSIAILEKMYSCKLPYLREIKKYIRNDDGGGTEFINEDGIPTFENIILFEFPLLNIKTEKMSAENVEKINNCVFKKIQEKKIEEENLLNKLIQEIDNNNNNNDEHTYINTYTWNEREYQTKAIQHCTDELLKNNKMYLDMATGSGKTYTTFKIMSNIPSDIIVIISPRKKINTQNTTDKYLSLLNEKYETYNLSKSGNVNFDEFYNKNKKKNNKSLIISCYQSVEKLYNIIKNYSDMFIWFDEAHWATETWINKKQSHTEFLLYNNLQIKYKLFTSASPNKEIIDVYSNKIFGEYYIPIKVSELIKQKYLCDIVPHIYGLDENNINICDYIINNFNVFNSTYGFSFHHTQQNALDLFMLHYYKFIDNETTIKPYLLISGKVKTKTDEQEIEDEQEIDNENKIDICNFEPKNINLSYDFMNIDDFERSYNSETYSGCIGYTCKQYTMGYDFNKIDYIVFSDAKVSYPDIIQCIGRGTRPDNLGDNGTNLNKKLNLMIPAYITNNDNIDGDANTTNNLHNNCIKYKNIVQVLRYLVKDIELEFSNIDIREKNKNNTQNKQDEKAISENKYDGENTIYSQLFELVMYENEWTEKKITRQLKENNIYSPNAYMQYCKDRPDLKLPPFSKLYTKYENFCWADCAPNGMYYKTSTECIEAITKLVDTYELAIYFEENDINKEQYLSNLDKKIPHSNLNVFYNTNNIEYY